MTEKLLSVPTGEAVEETKSVVGQPAWPVLKDAVETDPPLAVEGRFHRLRRRGRARQAGRPARAGARDRRDRGAGPAAAARRRVPPRARRRPARLGRRRLRRAGLPRLAARLPARRGPRRRPASTWWSSRCTPRTATRTATSKRSLLRVVWPEWLGRVGAHPLRQPDVRADHLRGLHLAATTPTPRCSSRRPSPSARRRSGSPGAASSATARPPASAGSPTAAVDTLGVELPEDAARWSPTRSSRRRRSSLWDMIHDRTHSHGDLPFDPFMIKQRAPFWMYGLEELRCDLTAFKEAVKLEAEGVAAGPRRPVRGPLRPDVPLPASPATGCATTTGSAASCSSPTCTSTTCCAGPTTRCSIDWERATEVTKQLCARDRGALPRRHRPAQARPLVRRVRAGRRPTSSPHPGSRWAKGPDALDLSAAAAQARRRRAARRVPAQHVLRGPREEAAGRDRLDQGDHRRQRDAATRPERRARGRGGPPEELEAWRTGAPRHRRGGRVDDERERQGTPERRRDRGGRSRRPGGPGGAAPARRGGRPRGGRRRTAGPARGGRRGGPLGERRRTSPATSSTCSTATRPASGPTASRSSSAGSTAWSTSSAAGAARVELRRDRPGRLGRSWTTC